MIQPQSTKNHSPSLSHQLAQQNMSQYAQQLHNTLISQSYMSVPQERKSNAVNTIKDANIFFQHNQKQANYGFQQPQQMTARNSLLIPINPLTASVSPQVRRMLRVSDLSNVSANAQNGNNLRLTPDTQENSQIFYQSTYGGHDLQPMTPINNMFMNRQLNIDDDELIEIRPDMNTGMGFGQDDQQFGLFRENSRDSTCSFNIDQNFIDNQSLENVKDTTNNNSPSHNMKKMNSHLNQNRQKAQQENQKEIFIQQDDEIEEDDNQVNPLLQTQQKYQNQQKGMLQKQLTPTNAPLNIMYNQLQNETGILRYSLANQTTFIKRQRRPYEEIMKRRQLREIIVQSSFEMQFSRMKGLEIEGGIINDQDDQKEKQEDSLYQMQNDLLEDLIMGKHEIQNQNQQVLPNQNQKIAKNQKQNNNLKIDYSSSKNQLLSTPQRQSKIDPIIEKIVSNEDDVIYLQSEQPESDNVTPINNQCKKSSSRQLIPNQQVQLQFSHHQKNNPSVNTDGGFGSNATDMSVTVYDARTSGSINSESNKDGINTYRKYEDESQFMKPIIEEDEDENLLSSIHNGSRNRHQKYQNQGTNGSYNSSSRQQTKPVMFGQHTGEESFEDEQSQLIEGQQNSRNHDEEDEDYRTEETLENDDPQTTTANKTSIYQRKKSVPSNNSRRQAIYQNAVANGIGTEESPNIKHDEDSSREGYNRTQDKIINIQRLGSYMSNDINSLQEIDQNSDDDEIIDTKNDAQMYKQPQNLYNFTLDNIDFSSQSMVQVFGKNLQNAGELRVSRTKTVYQYRDSNLQDTSRGIKERGKYNPDYTMMQMEELNKSVVFKLRPSNYQKKTAKQMLKKPSGTDDIADQDETIEDDSKLLSIYHSKPTSALRNREFISPVITKLTKFEDDPIPKQKKDLSDSRNNLQVNTVAKSMTITQSFTDLLRSTQNLLNPNKKRISLGDIQENQTDSLYYLMNSKTKIRQHIKLKSQRYYEQFLIIGIDQDSLQSMDHSLEIDRLVPKTLIQNPNLSQLEIKEQHDKDILNERSKVVKDFCFPNGVLAIKLNYNADEEFQNDPEVNEIITDILYRQKNYRESTFIFTLDANEEVGESGDNYMNCICVTYNELMRRQSDQQLFLVQKGFCFMFNNNYFPLHLEVLNGLLQSIKLERFKQPADFYESGHQQILREINSALSVPLFTEEVESILSQYYNLVNNNDQSPSDLTIALQINNNLGDIKYTFPNNLEDCRRLDCMWFCPTIFSLFFIEDFYRILTAVLLERSLIFVSDNLPILTSVVLGFKSLIKPFQWCYALIPVLPSPLIDILDTPQPILCGITRHDYKNIQLSEDELRTKTWIFLDEDSISVNWGDYDADLSTNTKKRDKIMKWCKKLIKETEGSFSRFYSNNNGNQETKRSFQGRLSDHSLGKAQQITRQTLAPIEEINNSVVLSPNDIQKAACRQIFARIQEEIDTRILMNIPASPSFKIKSSQLEVDMYSISEQVLERAKKKDEHEFLKEFIKTQMYTTLVEDFFNKSLNID